MATSTKRTNYGIIMKKYRRNFDEAINEKMMRLGSEVADTVAYAVATKAQDKLIQYGATRAKNSKSMALIQELADSIEIVDEKSRVVSTGSGYYAYKKKISGPLVKIPTGKNRIALFLEFGTGLVGANSRSDDIKEESKRFGWRYAINDGTEKTINTLIGKFKTKWYPTITLESGRKITGFIFRRKGNQYLDREDRIFRNQKYEIKRIYVPPKVKTSKNGKSFVRSEYDYIRRGKPIGLSDTEFVISRGLPPARFIYDTKVGVSKVLKEANLRGVTEKQNIDYICKKLESEFKKI